MTQPADNPHKISTNLAIRMRVRGLKLNPDAVYENPRVSEIAKEQHELLKRMDVLDAELESLQMG